TGAVDFPSGVGVSSRLVMLAIPTDRHAASPTDRHAASPTDRHAASPTDPSCRRKPVSIFWMKKTFEPTN
ncbi:MAG: hypothetical protein ACI9LO_001550, partial [Planctomycetota bacterium]